ncbi:MAG: hypothetical protein ACM31C_14020 [Acidobacteriota bacterium]
MRLLLVLAAGCAAAPTSANPNAGLFRDFLDGKFDAAGHPLNAVVLAATPNADVALPTGVQDGELVANVRLRVRAHGDGSIATVSAREAGKVVASVQLTTSNLRADDAWIDLPVTWQGHADTLRVDVAAGAQVDVDYVEVFPQRFALVAAPGSGLYGDADHVQIELPLGGKLDRVVLDGSDLTAQLAAAATRTDTAFRTLLDVTAGDLAPARGDVAELALRGAEQAARLELRRTPPACSFAGDPAGEKVIVTGFQPFPADATHDNVSGVAVTALDATAIPGAQVMKLILPVEYDRAAAEVADAIARCQPDVVISFGQGGDAIALEEVAYNLQDTGELAGGAPDNRGIVRAAQPIDDTAPATRDTRLPLDAIEHALVAAGEAPEHSRDPGRYVCNNVMFADLGSPARRAGFIHLPYTTEFDDAARARFANVVALAIRASL